MGFTMHNSKSFFDKKFGKTAFTWLISVVFIFSNFATVFANSVSPLELRDETNPGAQESFQENIEDFPTTDIESTSAYEDGLNLSGTFINKDQLHLFSLAMPQLENRERNVIVYLPSDYHNGEISYPVIYVLDARSLFIQPSFSPEDRILNEALYQFYTREHGREVIIVGIESDPIHIWDEYGPWVNQNMYLWMDPYEANQVEGGKGDAFLDFMEQTLKPAIDERYRTLSDRENTSIAGYKMGGLLSVYAGLTRAETYAEVMAMSPAVWFAESGQEWLSGNHLLIMIDRDGVPENVFFSLDVDPKDRVTDLIDRPAILDSQGSKISFPQAHVEGTQALVEGLLRRGYSALEVIGGIDTPTEWTQTMIDSSHELLEGNFLNYLPLILKPALISPQITSASSATFSKSSASSFTITTSGYPVPTISISGTLPAGITFTDNHNGTAKLAGTPTGTGTYTLTITAQNGVAPDATQTFTLNVIASPLITSASSVTFTKSAVSSFTITTSGYPVPTISISGTLPAGITFTDNHNGTAKLAGTPTATGTYTLTITAQNGVAPNATQTFTLKVVTPPLITSASSATFTKSTVSSFTITTSGYPVPTISISGTLPAGITFTDNHNGTANLAGTPTATGTYTLTITAQNGVAPNATQTFTLKVIASPLITSASSVTFTKSSVSSFTITTSGYPVPTISVSGSMPAGISFKDDGNGTARIYGTPTALGTYTLTITAQNGVTPNATQTFTLKVIEGCPGPGSCLITFSMNMSPYLNRTRNVAVYLPPNYNSGNYYPVIYLMDAQHMFGAQIGAPVEDNVDWKMDETLDSHYSSYGRGVIAVGIWIDTHYPWSEYTITPNPNMDHWWSGESFAAPDGGGMINFIRYVLKPEIDSRFHTLTDRDHTAIGGGSRCALLALYAGLLAKETFSRVMAMSPAVWIAESKYEAHVDIPGLTTWRTCSGVTYCNGLEWWIKHNDAPTNVRYFLYIGTSEQSGYVYPYVQLSTNPDHQIRIEYAYVDGARMVKNALISDGVQSISYIENDGGTHEPKVWRNFIIPNVLPFFEW